MKLLFLGTGAADYAVKPEEQMTDKDRRYSGILANGEFLLDVAPQSFGFAQRCGVDFSNIRFVLSGNEKDTRTQVHERNRAGTDHGANGRGKQTAPTTMVETWVQCFRHSQSDKQPDELLDRTGRIAIHQTASSADSVSLRRNCQ